METRPEIPDEDREARRKRQRLPESYESVTKWFADYRGFVPLQMAHGSELTKTGMSFHDAYLKLLKERRIIELEPWPREK